MHTIQYSNTLLIHKKEIGLFAFDRYLIKTNKQKVSMLLYISIHFIIIKSNKTSK